MKDSDSLQDIGMQFADTITRIKVHKMFTFSVFYCLDLLYCCQKLPNSYVERWIRPSFSLVKSLNSNIDAAIL